MSVFEILIAESATSRDGGPFVPDDRLTYCIPDAAAEHLEPILGAYDQDAGWFFDKLNFGRPPAPWAIACLDREYALAGHVVTCRPPDEGILFTAYRQIPNPCPDGFKPDVGILTFASKIGLERSAAASPLFAAAWEALRDCPSERRWLAILDPLPQQWLAQVIPGDSERWTSHRSR
jgi:hypothetical protein